jgi:WD40 repeat protein
MTGESNSSREERLQEALASYLQAREAGHHPDRQEWLAHYPDLAGELADFFANHDQFARLAHPVAPAAPRRPARAGTPATTPAGAAAGLGGDAKPDAVRYFGDYEVLGEIARGGMGVVLRARQVSLNRPVALKMILAGQLASDADVQRFRTEAEAAASLDHPHIVPIYEIGEHEGQQYFSMKLVEGPSLAQLLEDGTWQILDVASQRRAAELMATVARAVHYAHQRRILHRDLKPANILLAACGLAGQEQPNAKPQAAFVPHITDFGLAKRVEGDSKVTQSGAIVGTPSYMAPEQARGEKRLTTAADVYSLGAILHELLTGRPPFRGATPLDTLLDVVEKEVPPLHSLNPQVDRDLETICLKCLDKDPARRYGSAEALAEDLARWLRGEPIQARRTGMVERTLKWARRRPAIAALLGLLLLVSGLGVAGIVWKWLDAQAAERTARAAERDALLRAASEAKAKEEALDARGKEAAARKKEAAAHRKEAAARKKEEDAKNEALKARAREARARQDEHKARNKAEEERDAKERARVRAEGLRLSAEGSAALHNDPGLSLLLALEGVQRTPHRLTFNVLRDALRDCREVRTLSGVSGSVRYGPGGRFLVSASGSWDPATGKTLASFRQYRLLPSSYDLSPDGQRIVSTIEGYQDVYYRDGKQPRRHVFTDRVAYIWDPTTGKELLHLRKHRDRIVDARFSPDGKTIVTASWDNTAALWDASTGKQLHLLKGHECSLRTARFSPNGRQVLTVTSGRSEGGHGLLWSLEEEKTPNKPGVRERDPGIVNRKGELGESGAMHSSVSLTGENPVARLWDARTGKQTVVLTKPRSGGVTLTVLGKQIHIPIPSVVARFSRFASMFQGHPGHPTEACFSPDGLSVVIGFEQDDVCVWDARKGGMPRFFLRGHEGRIHAVAFSPNGKAIVSAGDDRTARLWDPASGKLLRIFWGHQGPAKTVRFSADGKQLLTGSGDGTARLWDVATGEMKAAFRGHGAGLYTAEFAPDGKHILTSAADGTTRIWTIAPPPNPALVLKGHTGKLNSLAFSPDGSRLLTAAADDTPRLWDVPTGKMLLRIGKDRQLGEIRSARFSSDGQRIVTASAHTHVSINGKVINPSSVHLWDARTGADVLALKDHKNGALDALLSPDGKVLATVSDGNVQSIVRGSTLKGEVTTTGNRKPGLVRLWDAGSGKLLLTLDRTLSKESFFFRKPFSPSFSPDSKHLLVKYPHEEVFYLLDLAGKTRASFPHAREGWGMEIYFAAFSPDSKRLLTVAPGGRKVYVWDTAKGVPVALYDNFPSGASFGAFSPDGRRLLIVAEKTAYVWDATTRTLLATLQGNEDGIVTAAFSADGKQIVTGARDSTAMLWDAASGKTLALYTGHTAPVHLVAFSPDGKRVATGSEDGTARIWPADLVAVARGRLPRQLTAKERERYALPAPGAPLAKEVVPSVIPAPGPEGAVPLAAGPRTLPAADETRATQRLEQLRARVSQPGGDRAKIREDLLALRRDYPGTRQVLAAATLLGQLPSPLDTLDPDRIPAEERFPGQPKEIVAILGEQRLRQHATSARVLISPDGRVIASVGRSIRLWDARTGEARGVLSGQLLGFVARTGALVTLSDKRMRFWDVTGTSPRELSSLAHAGTGKLLSADGKVLASMTESGGVRLWEVGEGKTRERALLRGHRSWTEAITFSADGRRMATCGYDALVRVWDLSTAKPRQLAELSTPARTNVTVALSPDGKLLAVSGGDRSVRLWDLSGPAPRERSGIMKMINTAASLAFSADSKMLAVPGVEKSGVVTLWDVSGPQLRKHAEVAVPDSWIYAVAFSGDGKTLVCSTGHTIRILDLTGNTPRERVPLRGHTGSIMGLTFAPDRPLLVSAGQDGKTRLWDLSGGTIRETAVLPGGWGEAAISPDGKTLAVGHGRSPLRLWDLGTTPPRQRAVLPGHSGSFSLAFSGDGRVLATGSANPILRFWDLSTFKPSQRFVLPNDKERASVDSIALSPDDTLLVGVAGGRFGNRVAMWRVTNKGPQALPAPGFEGPAGWSSGPTHVALSPDGKTLAFATQNRADVSLLDLTNPVPVVRQRLTGRNRPDWGGSVASIAFSADGRLVACTAHDGRVVVWETESGKVQHEWKLPGAASRVAFAADGRYLATGNSNGTIYVFRLSK